MYEAENKFYQENREALREKYLGKRIIIVKDKILGAYDTNTEALDEATKTMAMGTFCLKYIPVDPKDEKIWLRTFI